ncbi:MAG: hypothetical protein JAZ17_07875 [Candidatus Thiodiazotropha endolucinida]|nr:hypothetical protein [Candidatus Thiodiazotropha endolucinida]
MIIRINITKKVLDNIDLLVSDLVEIGATPYNTVFHVVRAIDHGRKHDADSEYLTNKDFAKIWVSCLKKIKNVGFSIPHIKPLAFNCSFDSGKAIFIDHQGKCGSCTSIPTSVPINKNSIFYSSIGGENGEPFKRNDAFFDSHCQSCVYLPSCVGGCQYLEAEGEEKCAPEKYVFSDLIKLTYS